MIIKCEFCQKEFNKYPSSHQRFCSIKCYIDSRIIKIRCEHCLNKFSISRKAIRIFCSKKCEINSNKQKVCFKINNPIQKERIKCEFCSHIAVRFLRGKSYCNLCFINLIEKGGIN